MTKYIRNIYLPLILAFVAFACTDNDGNETVGFSLGIYDTDTLYMNAEGGKETILIETNESWVATTNVPWITISPANGIGTAACDIFIDSTLVNDKRTASVRFTPSVSKAKSMVVEQYGFDKLILVKDSVIEIESSARLEDRFFETEVISNVQFNVEIDSLGDVQWLSTEVPSVKLDRGARPRPVKLRFDWKMNTIPEQRVAEIKFVPVNEEDKLKAPAVISVIQKPAVKIEDNRAGDSIAVLVINERLNCWGDAWDPSENMRYWKGLKLWEETDSALPCRDAIGRVRSVEYFLIDTEESVPEEIKHLKYLESLSISSNINTMLLSIDLGTEICALKHLKNLRLFSYGLVSLPEEFVALGDSLEVLDLSANNFDTIPGILTPENFPRLKSLNLISNRRWSTNDLRKKSKYENGIGLHLNTDWDNSLRRLLLWENLEELALSNCYIEGSIPDFVVGEEGVVAYSDADVEKWGGDTIQYLADNKMPKILPNCTSLRLNLNYFTGELPQWLLYHPHLLEWIPELLIFNQYEKGIDSDGDLVGFSNVPSSFDYYYNVFPGMRDKFELKEEITNE